MFILMMFEKEFGFYSLTETTFALWFEHRKM